MKPIFSVLIPVYNVEKYLEQCFESVLCQSFTDYEVVAVDDGSTDSSGEICERYAQKYGNFKAVHKKNEGLISARRKAIEEANGEYCVFLDSDDRLCENCLQKLYESIELYKPDTVIYTYYRFDENGNSEKINGAFPSGEVFEGERKKELYRLISSGSAISSIWTKAVKLSVLRKDKTDYSAYYGKNMAEDVFQSISMLTLSERIVYLNEPLYCYRYNTQSISRNFSLEKADEKNTLHVYYALKRHLDVWGCTGDDDKLKLDANHFNTVMYFFSKTYRYEKNKKAVLEYDWSKFLPDEPLFPLEENKYINKKYLKVYRCIGKRKFFTARLEMTKMILYSKYREIKKKCVKNAGN